MTEQVGSARGPLAEGPGPWFSAVLFTDIQESTPLWERYPDRMPEALARHHRIIEQSVTAVGGTVVKNIGDGFVAAFPDTSTAVAAAVKAQASLSSTPWDLDGDAISVRMAVDCGDIEVRDNDVAGPVVNRCARLMDVAHGGQILVSDAVVDRLDGAAVALADLGSFSLKGITEPVGAHRVELPTDVSSPPTPEPQEPGGIGWAVRGFELRERIGAGLAGVVYRAHQRSVGREVAIKLIRPEYANDRRFVHRFETEAQFIARLEHPHIVSLYDYWRDPDGAYLVMRWLRGGSLRQALERGPWHEQPTIRLLQQVGSALAYAHKRGVIHRDVRPSNVLLDEEGNGYLSDFGIASRPLTEGGGSVSTSSEYRSPEEITGRPLTEATDQFCLAMLAHELLTGRRPSVPFRFDLGDAVTSELSQAIRRATADDPADRFPSVEAFLAAVGPTLDLAAVEIEVSHNPFKGLRPFFETDAADFFGRDRLIARLVDAVASNRLVTVVGASGSGKSSAVRAGLVPALRSGAADDSDRWFVADLYPGANPFEELASALLSIATRPIPDLVDDLSRDPKTLRRVVKQIIPTDSQLVLIVDQFEELFTLASPADRRVFLDAITDLVTDPHARARVVVTLRADFYDRPLVYSRFAALLEPGLVSVPAPTREELVSAIVDPSRAVGLTVDPALVELILAEIVDQPGALPLLQYTLTELFDARAGNRLTTELFTTVGGVRGSLGGRAEAIFVSLDPATRTACEQVFLRLVSVEENAEDTRRRITRASLDDLGLDAGSIEMVLEAYGRHRLLTFDHDPTTRDPTVELAHEALLRGWSRLASWIDERRQDLITEHHLAAAVSEWEESGRDPDHLLSGSRLARYETWAHHTDLRLADTENVHLSEARLRENDRVARRHRARRLITAGFALIALIATSFAIYALSQRQQAIENERLAELQAVEAERNAEQARQAEDRADDQRLMAERSAREATARELASAATANLDEDTMLSILLASEAIRTTLDPDGYVVREAEEALHEALAASRAAYSIPVAGGMKVAFDPSNTRVFLSSEDGLVVADLAAEVQIRSLADPAHAVAVSPDGTRIVTGGEKGEMFVYDHGLQLLHSSTPHSDTLHDIAFSPDGSIFATYAWDGTVKVWNSATLEVTDVIEHGCVSPDCRVVSSIAFDESGGRLAVASNGPAYVYDVEQRQSVNSVPFDEEWPLGVVFLPGGDLLAASYGADGSIRVFDVENGIELFSTYGHSGSVTALALSPDGETLASGGGDGLIHLWTLGETGARITATLAGQGQVSDLAFSPDGSMLVSVPWQTDTPAIVWSIDGPAGEVFAVETGNLWWPDVRFDNSGRVVVGNDRGGLTVWDPDAGQEIWSSETEIPAAFYMVGGIDVSSTGMIAELGAAFGVDETYNDLEGFEEVEWVRVYEADGTPIREVEGPGVGWPFDVAFSDDGTLFGIADADGGARVYDTTTWELVFEPLILGGDEQQEAVPFSAHAIGFSPDSRYLAVEIWPDNEYVTDADSTRVWDMETGEIVAAFADAPNTTGTSLFDATGDRLLTAGQDLPTVWNIRTKEMEFRVEDVGALTRRASWSHDRSKIVAGMADGSITIWNGETGESQLRLRTLGAQIMEAVVSRDGTRIASVDYEGVLRVWTLDVGELLETARSRLTRDFTDDECRTYLHLDSCSER